MQFKEDKGFLVVRVSPAVQAFELVENFNP